MEIVAIPLWMGRVSPVFDTATQILIVEIKNGRYTNREMIEVKPAGFTARISFLQARGVHKVLCGAISKNLHNRLCRSGIEVFSFLSGDVSKLLRAYSEGGRNLHEYLLPGCRRRQRRVRGSFSGTVRSNKKCKEYRRKNENCNFFKR
ncbi:MAG: NifB/NifX family molybdenum-iron cluster-binding protein [candidate division Zixibacteria bacterium]|nr:NifB/NifX family molybdenum-iron cluster-binding protein [candidate division Zixibacteria bacterium]